MVYIHVCQIGCNFYSFYDDFSKISVGRKIKNKFSHKTKFESKFVTGLIPSEIRNILSYLTKGPVQDLQTCLCAVIIPQKIKSTRKISS